MTARIFDGDKLVVASHNQGKVREIRDLLGDFVTEVYSAGDLDLPEPVEDGDTFIANAIIKAKASAEGSGLPALADDSGLAVHALGGAPGIYSARWAGKDKDFNKAMQKVEDSLTAEVGGDVEKRGAAFICALALAWPDGHVETFEGRVEGLMVWPPRGEKGFGYDPTFQPVGKTVTFAEMDPAEKHSISHRADAFHQLVAACFKKAEA